MGKIVFVLGGARSGKSSFAVEKAKELSDRVAFIATCEALDTEMQKRIMHHKRSRPAAWKTVDAPLDIPAAVRTISPRFSVILIDCLTLLVSNLMLKGSKDTGIAKEAERILSSLKDKDALAIIVSNEVGLGIVPENALARRFRDIAGRVNQIIARGSDEVYFLTAGIPRRLK